MRRGGRQAIVEPAGGDHPVGSPHQRRFQPVVTADLTERLDVRREIRGGTQSVRKGLAQPAGEFGGGADHES